MWRASLSAPFRDETTMRFIVVCAPLALLGCAGSTPAARTEAAQSTRETRPQPAEAQKPAASPDTARAPAPRARATTTRDLPTECTSTSPCLPPAHFAESMCKGNYPSVALAMFQKSTPWQRKWVNVRTLEAVNAFGGSSSGGPLTFGEEVVLLRSQQAGGQGMQVSGVEDVEILRWNGTCVTVRESELVEYVPGLPKHTPITWAYLDESTQEALLANKTIANAREQQRRECKGSSKRDLSPSCEKSSGALDSAIVIAVRKGLALPMPEKRPEWTSPEGDAARTAAN